MLAIRTLCIYPETQLTANVILANMINQMGGFDVED